MTAKGVVERMGDVVPEPLKSLLVGQKGADGSYTQTLDIRQGVVFAGLIPVGTVPPLQ
jgi:hypothetical protein